MTRWLIVGMTLGLILSGCAATSGKFRALSDEQEQHIVQNLGKAWEVYVIRIIPERALLLDRKDDRLTILVDRDWIEVANRETWLQLLQRDVGLDGRLHALLPMTGFKEIQGAEGQSFGFLTHATIDLVSLTVVDERTLRLYYVKGRTSGR